MMLNVMLDEGAKMPTRAHAGDAGLDLYSPVKVVIPARGMKPIDTGVHVEIPFGAAGFLKSKSGLNVKHGITSEGVIDYGYTGSIVANLYNHTDNDYIVEKGDKITQLVLEPILLLDTNLVEEFEKTERGDGGFGSTGR